MKHKYTNLVDSEECIIYFYDTSPLTLQQHNMDKNMDHDPKKVASKGGLKPMRTGIQRTALGDIRNVTKVCISVTLP